ncbi:MAG: hypothetical protein ABIL45_04145 [candidate division WOR-3 bacterium]
MKELLKHKEIRELVSENEDLKIVIEVPRITREIIKSFRRILNQFRYYESFDYKIEKRHIIRITLYFDNEGYYWNDDEFFMELKNMKLLNSKGGER